MLKEILGSTAIALLIVDPVHAIYRENNLGKLPALGYNTYNAYKCANNEADLLSAANSIVSLGLKSLGYTYVNIDDCWSVKSGRDSSGNLQVDTTKFPDGISGAATKIHNLGLKMGIYSSAGTLTCSKYPGSLGHEDADAALWASWGIDYLKYDNCYFPASDNDKYKFCVPDSQNPTVDPGPFVNGTCNYTNQAPKGYDWSTSKTAARFNAMRDAIAKQSRPILYSLCEWGQADVTSWGNETGSSWRTTGDIQNKWTSVSELINENSFLLNSVDFYGHNDWDMLQIGNGVLTLAESRTHFAFWAAGKSPLLIGTNLSAIPSDELAILKNTYLLGFNQDTVYGKPATPYKWGYNPNWTFDKNHPAEYWSGRSTKGVLVLIFNSQNATASRTMSFSEVPQLSGKGNSFEVTDIWSGSSLGCVATGIRRSLVSHDTAGFLVGAACTP